MDLTGKVDYIGFKRIIDRGTADIIEETDDLLFMQDTESKAYMLVCDDSALALAALDRHRDRGYDLLETTCKEAADYMCEKYGFDAIEPCHQFAYLGEIPEEDPRVTLRTAGMDDLPTIMEVYHEISDDEMAVNIRRGAVFMAYDVDDLVGIIGEHTEGSQGMLYIYPEHRRKGYAQALEHAMFAKAIRKGEIPFGQVVDGNTASMELQKKNGLTEADRMIYWTWKED